MCFGNESVSRETDVPQNVDQNVINYLLSYKSVVNCCCLN